jgi:hypothetical protein
MHFGRGIEGSLRQLAEIEVAADEATRHSSAVALARMPLESDSECRSGQCREHDDETRKNIAH